MKISLVSDLHLEFGYQELPGGEVLILAGDIAEARSISKHRRAKKMFDDQPDKKYACSEFFKYECAKYQQVFYVKGNHEHYHGRMDKTYDELKSLLPSNITLLEKQFVDYQGVRFLGATMWTDFHKGDPIAMMTAKQIMNDYRTISNHYPDSGLYHKLTPEFIYRVHKDTLAYFESVLDQNKEIPTVIITHHGPSWLSINDKYIKEYVVNGAFTSDLSNLMLDHPNIKFWVHGHMHDPVDYQIGECRILSNPRGYVGHEDTSQFEPSFHFEL